jgi:hypothetical protein
LASGAGSLIYTITGTPSAAGTADFALSIGGQSCTLNFTVSPVGTLTTLDCALATNNGTLTSGTAASGVSSDVPYSGGNGGTYNGETISSTGVSGLTATLSAGILAMGSGSLNYLITGTPTAAGTASFALNIGGQSCSLSLNINSGIPATGGSITEFIGNGTNGVNGAKYLVHTFSVVGIHSFVALMPLTNVEYLVVGGGGGGGLGWSRRGGGGGGAGGFRTSVPGSFSGGGSVAETPLNLSQGT